MQSKIKSTLIGLLVLILGLLTGNQVSELGGSPGNLASDFSTSSTVQISNDSVVVLFPTSTPAGLCASRVIATNSDVILIRFSPVEADGRSATTSLQNRQGFVQLASTTVNYDSSVYGCGAWIVTGSDSATTSITITEFK